MDTYTFIGTVLPERAQLSLEFNVRFRHLQSGIQATANVSVLNNQLAASIETEGEWDLFTLRNTVRNVVQSELAIFGYMHGLAYDFDIARAINKKRNIDYVFGIEISELADPDASIEKAKAIREKFVGPEGILIRRCLKDLVLAMKDAEDTAFYCYRAINRSGIIAQCGMEFPLKRRRYNGENFTRFQGMAKMKSSRSRQQPTL